MANCKSDRRERELVNRLTELDQEIAEIKLNAGGVGINSLSEEQTEYMDSWEDGT